MNRLGVAVVCAAIGLGIGLFLGIHVLMWNLEDDPYTVSVSTTQEGRSVPMFSTTVRLVKTAQGTFTLDADEYRYCNKDGSFFVPKLYDSFTYEDGLWKKVR